MRLLRRHALSVQNEAKDELFREAFYCQTKSGKSILHGVAFKATQLLSTVTPTLHTHVGKHTHTHLCCINPSRLPGSMGVSVCRTWLLFWPDYFWAQSSYGPCRRGSRSLGSNCRPPHWIHSLGPAQSFRTGRPNT